MFLRRCLDCIPRSSQVLQASAGIMIFFYLTMAFFSRSVYVIGLSFPCILVHMEVFYTVRRNENWFLGWYFVFNLICVTVSLIIGSYLITRLNTVCSYSYNPDTCSNTQLLMGVLLLLGSATASLFMCIMSGLAYFRMRKKPIKGFSRFNWRRMSLTRFLGCSRGSSRSLEPIEAKLLL